jgi:acetyl esterase
MDFAAAAGPPEEMARVENLEVPGPAGPIPVRVYVPEGDGPFPVLVYFHGGGWVIGNLDSHDVALRALANRAGTVVASVDYRLAPEHPFPAAPEDCYAATVWAATEIGAFGGDPARLAVGGDSAGGNLAAVVSQMARDRGGPAIVYQLLVYPCVDASMSSASFAENGDGYLLTKGWMDWFYGHYLTSPTDADNPLVSPSRAESLAGLPPALVITAEFDPLRDEGEAYAAALRAAGGRFRSHALRRHDPRVLHHGRRAQPQQRGDRARRHRAARRPRLAQLGANAHRRPNALLSHGRHVGVGESAIGRLEP